MRTRSIFAGLLATALAVQGFAQERRGTQPRPASPAPKAAATDSPDALIIYSAGLEGFLVSEKDKGLLKALRLVNERLMELPRELNEPQIPAPAIALAYDLFSGPMTLRAGVLPNNPNRQGPPIRAQFNFFTSNQEQAQKITGSFSGFANMVGQKRGQPSPDLPGMERLDIEGTPLHYGPLDVGGRSSFAIAINGVQQKALDLTSSGLPDNVQPVFLADFDSKRIQPLIESMKDQPGREQEIKPVIAQLKAMGLYGPDAGRYIVAMGYSPDRAHVAARFTNYTKQPSARAMMPDQRLTAADLRRIPADSTYAQITKLNLAGIGPMLNDMMHQMAEQIDDPQMRNTDVMQMVEQQTGINPQRDIFDHLGQTIGLYTSDTTGGGGWLSLTAFCEVKNVEGLRDTMTKITSMINQMAQNAARGYVRISDWKSGDLAITSLTFPGLPVPFEPSWAIADGYLYSAASPASLTAAIRHAQSGKTNLGDNPRFKEAGGLQINDAIQLSFLDTPRLLRDGYGLANLGVSALVNAVRSPTDPNRQPAQIMPTFDELAADAKASVSISRIVGDDMVLTGQFDRSMPVNITAGVGAIGGSAGVIAGTALMAGITLPAIGKARETAQVTRSQATLRQIATAVMTYNAEWTDAMPPDMKSLLPYLDGTGQMLHSPHGPVSDGMGDYWLNTSIKRMSNVQFPDQQILAYDRAMYEQGDSIAVVFFDGHAQQMSVHEFNRLITEAPNTGTDFQLP